MTPEGKVKAAIKRYLQKIGAWYCMPATGGYGKSGVPDFLVCWQGRFYAIEAKAPGKRHNTTDLQERQIVGINNAGGCALVVDDVSQLAEVFQWPETTVASTTSIKVLPSRSATARCATRLAARWKRSTATSPPMWTLTTANGWTRAAPTT